MVYHHLLDPAGGDDIEQAVFGIGGPLDADRLRHAWEAVAARHDALRTGLCAGEGGDPVAEVWAEAALPFVVDDRSAVPPAARDACVAELVRAERSRGFRLDVPPLQRVRLVRFGAESFTLIWTNHHAILDGAARRIVLREIVACYAGQTPRGPAVPPAPFARRERGSAAAPAFWRAYLTGVAAPTPLPLPQPGGEAAGSPDRMAVATLVLDAATAVALRALATDAGVTTTVIVQAAWAVLLARHAANPDVVFGVVRSCRRGPDADVVGLLVNTLPLRIAVRDDAELVPWLRDAGARWTALREVERTPLRTVAACSEIPAPTPLFDSLVVVDRESLASAIRTQVDPDDVVGIRSARMIDQTTCALTLAAAGTTRLELRLAADTRRYAAADAERLLAQVAEILRSMARRPRTVGEIAMLPVTERALIAGFNRTAPYPRDATVHGLFAAQAARTPNAVALQLGDDRLTYAQLAARGHAVAAYLQRAGIRRGDFVGLCIERSFEMVAALLGILEAGAASVALDPTHPLERRSAILDEARVTTILTAESVRAALDAAQQPAPVAVAAGDPAHVMYTSGSTGMPKGAVLPHRACVRTVCGTDYLRFDAGETFFAFVPLTFDVAVLEVWGPLLCGARLVLCPPGLPSLDVLGAEIERRGVTTLWLTTALFEQMVEEQLPRLRSLRQLIVGGDVMSPAHARRALDELPGLRLLNVYGPTEATVLITAHHVQTPPHAPIPLGRPIPNAAVHVLDALRRPVPIGVPGEIFTGEDGLALGYLNRPDLTAERFVPDPFSAEPNARMYRTGDLARWRGDGEVEFLGRIDTQVKIRGVRVEPGEIETALTEHPMVREAVVVTRARGAADKTLVAHVVLREDRPVAAAELTAFLARRLPAYMLPAFVIRREPLPRTATGKFDRAALPADVEPATSATFARRLPATAAEIAVATHVAEVLGVDELGCDDDVYARGCDSLRAMRLVARLRAAFRVDLQIRDVVAAPTVAALTATIARLRHGPPAAAGTLVTPLRTTGTRTPCFFFHGDLAGGGAYCRALAAALGDDRPLYTVAPHGTEIAHLPPSVEAMAREIAGEIRALRPAGPVVLGGFCNGGIVAYEAARELVRGGTPVERVVVIDAFNKNVAGANPVRRTLARLRNAARALGGRTGEPADTAADWEGWHAGLVACWERVLSRYVPGCYGGEVVLLWSEDAAPQAERRTAAWRRAAPRAHADRLLGTHLETISRALAATSRAVAAHIDAPARDWEQRARPDRPFAGPSRRAPVIGWFR
jgi:amino acid adenylation domain-containing protein